MEEKILSAKEKVNSLFKKKDISLKKTDHGVMQINTSLTNTQQEQGRSIEKVLGFNTFVNKVKSQTEKTGIQPSDDDIFLLMDIYKGKGYQLYREEDFLRAYEPIKMEKEKQKEKEEKYKKVENISFFDKAKDSIVGPIARGVGGLAGTVKGLGEGLVNNFTELPGEVSKWMNEVMSDPNTSTNQKIMEIIPGYIARQGGGFVGNIIGGGIEGLFEGFTTEDEKKSFTNKASEFAEKLANTETGQDVLDFYDELSSAEKRGLKSIMESLNLVGLESLLSNPAKKVVEKIGNKILNTTENVAEYATPLLENSYNAVGSTVKSLANTIETSAKNTLQRNLNDFVMKSAGKGLNTLKKTPIDMNKFVDDTIDAVGSIIKNKENLKFIDDIGEETLGRTPESLNEFSQAINQTKKSIYEQYNNIANKAGDRIKIETKGIIKELESLENDPTVNITTKGKISNTINNMKTQLEKYSELTIDQAQILTQQLNKNLESFYKNPNLNDIGSNMVDLLVNNNLKKSIDESIESVLGSNNYSELKQAYGSLRSIEDQVARRAFIDASKNAKGLIDFSDILSANQIVDAIATLNPLSAVKGATTMGIKNYFKSVNDPNRYVKKLFKTVEKQMGKTNKTIDDVVPGLDKVSNTLIPSNGSIIGKVGDNSIIFEKLPNSESFSLALKNGASDIGSVSIKPLANSEFMEIGKIIVDNASRNQGNATNIIKKALELLPEGKEGIIGIVEKFQDKSVMNRIFEKLGATKDYAGNWVLKK